MTPIFHDSFDVYGPVGMTGATLSALLQQWWTTGSVLTSCVITAGLSSTGTSIQYVGINCQTNKTLSANLTRVVGTLRFSSNITATTHGIVFADGVTAQCSITVNNTTGTISLRAGNGNATAIQTSVESVLADSTHVLSWDIVIAAAGAYTVRLDGVSILSGTGNTSAGTVNDYVNAIVLGVLGSGTGASVIRIDDFALIDGSVAFDAGVLTSSPRIETQIGTGDAQTQWDNVGTILGTAYYSAANFNAPGANQIYLRKYTPEVNETLNSVSIIPAATSAGAKFKAVCYPDSGGSPNGQTLSSTGTEVVGAVSGTILVGALTTPQSLIAGTPVWIGFFTDTSVSLYQTDTTTTGVKAANTYTSGAPATCPTVTTGQSSWVIYGNCTGAVVNWSAVMRNPAPGDISSISSETVGDEDRYTFPALTTVPVNIYFGGIRGNLKRSDSGARTVDFRMLSNITNSAGSLAGQTPALSYTWLNSYYALDPDTGAAWTASGWNAASSGQKIAS